MTVFEPAIEEYLRPKEWMQGNVNTAGLVHESTVDEDLEMSEYVSIVWEEWLDEGFDLSEDFTPSHAPWCHLEEELELEESLGVPIRVAQSDLFLVHEPPVTPVNVYWMAIDVLTGVDTFYEEVSSGLHFTEDTYVAKRYFSYCYESLDLVMENVPDNKIYACWKVLKMGTSDRVNMRHSVIQEYYFNNLAKDRVFAYDKQLIGWPHKLEDGPHLTTRAESAIGKLVIDHLSFRTGMNAEWAGQEVLSDRAFLWDIATYLRGWTMVIDEDLTAEEAVQAYREFLVQDRLMASELVKGERSLNYLAKDQMALAEKLVNGFDIQILDEFDMEDDLFRTWLGHALLDEQASLSVSSEPMREHNVQVTLSMSLSDTMS